MPTENEQLRRIAMGLNEALRRYGSHSNQCEMVFEGFMDDVASPCTCGLQAVKGAADQALEALNAH